MSDFEQSMKRLNDAQRAAVEHIDGPLIVIAGPGTGKTQLLSLRAANILRNRDVQPQNILCLTYTEAGAEAMRKRLIELIGRDGYGIEVATFHGFASACRARYPEYFEGGSRTSVVSSLHAQEILDVLLKGLPFENPLSGVFGGVASNISTMSQFISTMKRQGLSPDEYRAIMRQNIEAADYLESKPRVMELLAAAIPRAKAEKASFIGRFEEEALAVCSYAPRSLTENAIGAMGVYVPFITWMRTFIEAAPLIEGNSSDRFQKLKKILCEKDASGATVAAIRSASEKGLAAADVYEAYQARLAAEGLRDFDDMIMDFIVAVRENAQLRFALQEQYRYIQVDEFQDTNGAQMRIVEMLSDGVPCPNVMAVGDDDQAIMRFQGASIACIDQFRARFSPRSVVLGTNYRSTPEIVALGQVVANQVERRLPESATEKSIRAFRPSGEQRTFAETVFETSELQYLAVARSIRRRLDEGFVQQAKNPDEAIAVIAAKHASLRALLPYLKAENIPFSYVQTSDIFSLEPMQTTLALLRFVVAYSRGSRDLANSLLPQIIAAPEFGGTGESSIRFALFAKREHYGDWLDALAATDDVRLRGIYADLAEWSAAAPTDPVRELMFRITARTRRYYAGMSERNPLQHAEYNSGLRALLQFAADELGTAAARGRTMRLSDVVDRMEQAAAFGVGIDASINLGTPGAVRLTTAHSSKGLEFDLVYLLDAENGVWHKADRGGINLYPKNMLIGKERDEDDARRLLFVAVTRAKDYLEIFRTGGSTICELSGAVETHVAEAVPEDVARAIELSWRDSYQLDTPELKALLAPNLPPHSLSASALNLFVAYSEDPDVGVGAARFPQERVMGLPQEPQIFFEYGTIVHAYLEEYVGTVLKGRRGVAASGTAAGAADADALAARFRKQIACLDYPLESTQRYARQFDRMVQKIGPWLARRTDGLRLETEVKLMAEAGDHVPLFGYCDLVLVDDERKTIRVADYKTGFGYPEGKPDRAYQRQLQFYRLLIEGSSEFAGYKVVACENWYVEPAKDTGELHAPVVASVSDEDIDYLVQLIDAAWHRIARGMFDSSAFEASEERAQALAAYEKQGGRKTKKGRAEVLQQAYEAWLIREDAAFGR